MVGQQEGVGFGLRLLRLSAGLARRQRRSITMRRRAGISIASALAMACFARAAGADETAPTTAPGQTAPLADPPQQTPASPGAVPADPSNPLNPAPFALPQLAAPQFRADALAPSKPASAGPWGVLSGDWQNQNFLGDMGGLRPWLG